MPAATDPIPSRPRGPAAGAAGHRWRRRALLCALAALTAVPALELAVRLWEAVYGDRARVPHATLGWSLARDLDRAVGNEDGDRNRFATNEQGYRGAPLRVAKPQGHRRVLLLGDSFTEAIQVDQTQTFAARLTELAPQVEFVNAGVACYGTVQQLRYLEQTGLDLAPDAVLLQYCSNDLIDNIRRWFVGMGPRPHARLTAQGAVEIVPIDLADYGPFCLPLPVGDTARGFLWHHSMLYRYLTERVWQPARARELERLDYAIGPTTPPEDRVTIQRLLLDRLATLLAQRGVAFGLVVAPLRSEVEDADAAPDADLLAWARDRGVPAVSLLEPMRASRQAGRSPYFARDEHWNATGHRIAAEHVVRLLPWR